MEKSWEDGRLAWQLGIADWNNPLPSYTFNTNSFTVLNGGNVKIDPRYMPLTIVLKGSFSSSVTIKNNTTGETFTYNGPLTSSDILVLDKISYLKNGVHVTGATNKKLISLQNKRLRWLGLLMSTVLWIVIAASLLVSNDEIKLTTWFVVYSAIAVMSLWTSKEVMTSD